MLGQLPTILSILQQTLLLGSKSHKNSSTSVFPPCIPHSQMAALHCEVLLIKRKKIKWLLHAQVLVIRRQPGLGKHELSSWLRLHVVWGMAPALARTEMTAVPEYPARMPSEPHAKLGRGSWIRHRTAFMLRPCVRWTDNWPTNGNDWVFSKSLFSTSLIVQTRASK